MSLVRHRYRAVGPVSGTFQFAIPGTLGNDTGPRSDGTVLGDVPSSNPSIGWSDDGVPAFTNETTDMADAGADDVAVVIATAGSAVYFGDATDKFYGLALTIGTAGAGTYTGVWEYYNGSAWATLTNIREDVAVFKEAAAAYFNLFEPPATWATVAVNGTTAYYVRFKKTGAGTVTTAPLLTTAFLKKLGTGTGVRVPAGLITHISFSGRTASGATTDTKFLFIDRISKTFRAATWTKATNAQIVTLSSPWMLGDGNHELQVVQTGEDGTTEYANANVGLLYQ